MRWPTRSRGAISTICARNWAILLLQVVYHARMAEEDSHFDFGAVVETVTKKMIRRHPHVFGDETARGAGMAKGMWEKIKAEEKGREAGGAVGRGGLDPEEKRQGLSRRHTACPARFGARAEAPA